MLRLLFIGDDNISKRLGSGSHQGKVMLRFSGLSKIGIGSYSLLRRCNVWDPWSAHQKWCAWFSVNHDGRLFAFHCAHYVLSLELQLRPAAHMGSTV